MCGGFGGNTERRTSRVSVGPGEGRESSFVLLFCLSGWSDVLEFSIHLFMTLRVDPVTNVVDAVSRFVDRLTLPAREKKQLETDLQKLIQEIERDLVQARASIVVEETRGNWLQRSWRPLVMLTFATIVLVGTFINVPILSDTSRFWDLLEIGLGGYVVGRSGEKIMQAFARKPR